MVALITWSVILVIYLGAGVLLTRSFTDYAKDEGMSVAPWWAMVLLLPVAVIGAFPGLALRLWDLNLTKRIPPERLFNFIKECRQRQHKSHDRICGYMQTIRRLESRLALAHVELENRARSKARGLLNSKWADAADAARVAMSKVLSDDADLGPVQLAPIATLEEADED